MARHERNEAPPMDRRPVTPEDVIAEIVEALDGSEVGGGRLSATARGHEVHVLAHADAPGQSYNTTFNVLVQ